MIGTVLVQTANSGEILAPAIVMFGFAFALAVPFSLFAIFPSWLESMPKSGGWLNSVKVVLNTKEEVIITSPWTKEIEYIEGEYPFIESADDVINYDKFINGLSVDYNHKSNEPTWQETIEAQVLYTALMTDTMLEE